MADLFSDAASERAGRSAPLAQRLRPRSLDEFVGQEHVLGEGSALRRYEVVKIELADHSERTVYFDITENEKTWDRQH